MRQLFWVLRDINWIVFIGAFVLALLGAEGLSELLFVYAIGMWLAGLGARIVGYERPSAASAVDFLDLIDQSASSRAEGDRVRMAVCIVRLGLLMAAADGEVEQSELEAIRGFFRSHGADDEFIEFIDANILNAIDHFDAPRVFREVNKIASRAEKEVLLYAILSVAAADGRFERQEVAVFFGVATELGFSERDVHRILESVLGEVSEDDAGEDRPAGRSGWSRGRALATLGLDEGASAVEIKVSYRRMAQQYHPDKLSHLGPEFEDMAARRMQQINEAYSYLRV